MQRRFVEIKRRLGELLWRLDKLLGVYGVRE
jgi:hypothetical protein